MTATTGTKKKLNHDKKVSKKVSKKSQKKSQKEKSQKKRDMIHRKYKQKIIRKERTPQYACTPVAVQISYV